MAFDTFATILEHVENHFIPGTPNKNRWIKHQFFGFSMWICTKFGTVLARIKSPWIWAPHRSDLHGSQGEYFCKGNSKKNCENNEKTLNKISKQLWIVNRLNWLHLASPKTGSPPAVLFLRLFTEMTASLLCRPCARSRYEVVEEIDSYWLEYLSDQKKMPWSCCLICRRTVLWKMLCCVLPKRYCCAYV